jgi:peptidoglycan/xylan/chitin deacetylase (PgdA/CDA1 family)
MATLASEHAAATFFEVGVLERYFHASTADQVARGYPIGDHTQSHAPMARLSKADQRAQLLQQVSATGSYGAPFPRMFRPPYGLWNHTTLALLRGYRMLMVLWTIDSQDYKRPGVEQIVSRVIARAQPGAIVLLHDAGGNRRQTVMALPLIIRRLRAAGYRLTTVPQLLADNPAPADQSLPPGVLGGGS